MIACGNRFAEHRLSNAARSRRLGSYRHIERYTQQSIQSSSKKISEAIFAEAAFAEAML
jgi:hypothetical protein